MATSQGRIMIEEIIIARVVHSEKSACVCCGKYSDLYVCRVCTVR